MRRSGAQGVRYDPRDGRTASAGPDRPLPGDLRKTFVYASANPGSRFTTYAEASAADPAWQYHELPGPHFLMFSHPEEVAEIILDA